MEGFRSLVALVTILTIISKETYGQEDTLNVKCTSDSDCGQNELCLCDKEDCNNHSCTCQSSYLRNASGYCQPKKAYNDICSDNTECATLFSRCIRDSSSTGEKRCRCLEFYDYEPVFDLCTNAPPCHLDESFIYNKAQHNCHKLIPDCENCTDINDVCSRESKGQATAMGFLGPAMANRLAKTLWTYGIYQPSDCANSSEASPVRIMTSFSKTPLTCEVMTWDVGESRPFESVSSNGCQTEPLTVGCIIDLPPVLCMQDVDEQGVVWEVTEGGTTAIQKCSDGYEGTISRKCSRGGHFAQPINNCTRVAFISIKDQLNNRTLDANSALAQLNNETMVLAELYREDVVIVHDILDDIVDISTNVTLNDTSIEDFFNVTNVLLEHDHHEIDTEKLDDSNPSGIGVDRFLSRTEAFVSNVVQQNKTLQLNFSNIEVEIRQLAEDTSGIRFPNISHGTSNLFLAKEAFTGAGLIVNASSSLLYKNIPSSRSYRYKQRVSVLKRTETSKKITYMDNIPNIERNTSNIISSKIFSDVLSLKLYPESPVLLDPALVLYLYTERVPVGYSRRCAYWIEDKRDGKGEKGGSGVWSSEGCREVNQTSTLVQCHCDHLTNFAIMLSPAQAHDKHESALRIISLVGCIFSVVCLFLTIVLYSCYWRIIRSDNSILTLLLCTSLLVSYVVFMAGVDRTTVKDVCTAIAALLHYLYLVVFFAMLSKAIHMVILVMFVHNKKSYANHFIIGSLGAPAVIVGISLGASGLENYGSDKYCWLVPGSGVFWGFAGVILTIILINLIVTGLVLHKICNAGATKNKTIEEKVKMTTRSLLVLLPIMGVTWLFGIFSLDEDTVFFQYIFVILNVLQGVGIFIFHCVFNKQLKSAIKASRERKRTLEDINSDLKKPKPKTTAQTCTKTATVEATSKKDISVEDFSVSATDTTSTVVNVHKRKAKSLALMNRPLSLRKRMTCALQELRERVGFGRNATRSMNFDNSTTYTTMSDNSVSGIDTENLDISTIYSSPFTKELDAKPLPTLEEEKDKETKFTISEHDINQTSSSETESPSSQNANKVTTDNGLECSDEINVSPLQGSADKEIQNISVEINVSEMNNKLDIEPVDETQFLSNPNQSESQD